MTTQLHPPLTAVGFLDVAPEELASVGEIATMLNVPKRTAQRWIERPDFPAPIAALAVGRIWRRADVEAWAKKTLPLKRGPVPKK